MGLPICNGRSLKKLPKHWADSTGQGSSSECRFSTWERKNLSFHCPFELYCLRGVCRYFLKMCTYSPEIIFFARHHFEHEERRQVRPFPTSILTTWEDRMSFVFVSKFSKFLLFRSCIYIWCYISHHS